MEEHLFALCTERDLPQLTAIQMPEIYLLLFAADSE